MGQVGAVQTLQARLARLECAAGHTSAHAQTLPH